MASPYGKVYPGTFQGPQGKMSQVHQGQDGDTLKKKDERCNEHYPDTHDERCSLKALELCFPSVSKSKLARKSVTFKTCLSEKSIERAFCLETSMMSFGR